MADFGQTDFDLCLCVGFTVSMWGFQGFGLVMFGAPGTALPGDCPTRGPPFLGTPLPGDRPSPGPPKISLFSSLSGCLLVEFWWCF